MKRYILFLFTGVLFMCCSSEKKPEHAQIQETQQDTTVVVLTPEQIKNAGITTGNPGNNQVNGVLKLQGAIDVPPQSMVSVSFPLGGYLKRTDLLPGVHVKKGQVLGILEDIQFIQIQQDYLSAKEKLHFAETEFKRQKELNDSKASSDKVLQQAKTEMETQRINTNALAQKLSLIGINPYRLNPASISRSINILSPIDGFVAKVNVNIGKYTSPTDVLFELVNPKDIHLGLSAFEKDISQLSIGQKVIAYTNDNPDKKYEAEIILISRNLNEDRMADVHCHFENFTPDLLPGMFMNGEVEVNKQSGLSVDEEAIVRWQNQYYVFILSGKNTFTMVPVKLGNANGGRQQILSTVITPSTQVVIKNAYAILMKMKNSTEGE